ncbi:GNAT family N-acetyltransferase [Paractinoplanes maris]|uniref:GNAT family N-acetyltransferase n=1 Tax=Paractinoplanes maris TaxID=1734446 RepID=UPI002021C4B3|nr:GNAT family N-acetyltransferase [Actinoplanes maris]
MPIIRPYQPADRDAALDLAARLTAGVAPWRDAAAVSRAVTDWVRESIESPGTEVFVAVVDDRVAGLVTVGERRHFTGEVDAYVGELVVGATHERLGLGSLLMRAAEQWARARGLRRLTLETGAGNENARAFYAGRGFREEDVRLTKDLGAAPRSP